MEKLSPEQQQTVADFIGSMQAMSPDQRVAALYALRKCFCFDCGYEVSEPYGCHCTNDE